MVRQFPRLFASIALCLACAFTATTAPGVAAHASRPDTASAPASTTCGSLSIASRTRVSFPSDPTSTPSSTTYQVGYTPVQIKAAYHLNVSYTGAGVTVAIIDPCDDPTAANDLDAFSTQFGLPTLAGGCGCLTKVDQTGGTNYPHTDPNADHEISEDMEWVHAIAPGAHILLVEAKSFALSDMMTAEDYATAHAQVVSNSWAIKEFSGETAYDSHFNKPVAITVSAGDSGTPARYPPSSPYVLAVGGTNLTIKGTTSSGGCISTGCTRGSETVWNNGVDAGGGGASAYESQPGYQNGFCGTTANVNACGGKRGNPDVVWDAGRGVAVYNSNPFTFSSGKTCQFWCTGGGTSLGAPSVAGLIALADQAHNTVFTTNTLTSRFAYQQDASSANYASSYFDMTSGTNGLHGLPCCMAATGYDLASGLGSPNGAGWIGAA